MSPEMREAGRGLRFWLPFSLAVGALTGLGLEQLDNPDRPPAEVQADMDRYVAQSERLDQKETQLVESFGDICMGGLERYLPGATLSDTDEETVVDEMRQEGIMCGNSDADTREAYRLASDIAESRVDPERVDFNELQKELEKAEEQAESDNKANQVVIVAFGTAIGLTALDFHRAYSNKRRRERGEEVLQQLVADEEEV